MILVAAWGIYHALRMGVGDITAYRARYELIQWEKGKKEPSIDDIEYALGKASSALAWEPGNPEHMDLKALILVYKGISAWETGQFNVITDEAISLYQQSVELRPKWPLTWAHIALVKAYRAEFDDVFAQAIAKAVAYGPWEQAVHVAVNEAGMSGWANLDKPTRRHVMANLHRGLRFSPKELKEMAVQYQLKERICLSIPKDKFTDTFCRE